MPVLNLGMRFANRSSAETWLSKEGFAEQRSCVWRSGNRQAFIGLVLGGLMPEVVVNFQAEG